MDFTLMGEEFRVRTDSLKSVERYGNAVKVEYKDGDYSIWEAKNIYQVSKINLLEIVLRALMIGYHQGRNDLYDEGKVITNSIQQKLDAYDELIADLEPNPYKEYHEIKIS